MWSRDIDSVSSFLCSHVQAPHSLFHIHYQGIQGKLTSFFSSMWPASFLPLSGLLTWDFICSSRIRVERGTAFWIRDSDSTSPFPPVIQILKCYVLHEIGQIALGSSRYWCLFLFSNRTHAKITFFLNIPFIPLLTC